MPEVSLVCILDADKEGFLRSETSLIQMIGRTARHVNAEVVLYADTVTPSMRRAMDETSRRRALQLAYNQEHHITPETVEKEIRCSLERLVSAYKVAAEAVHASEDELDRTELIALLEKEMVEAAEALEFERAARLRDRIKELKEVPTLASSAAVEPTTPTDGRRRSGRRVDR